VPFFMKKIKTFSANLLGHNEFVNTKQRSYIAPGTWRKFHALNITMGVIVDLAKSTQTVIGRLVAGGRVFCCYIKPCCHLQSAGKGE